ncbi:MAG TPA: TetR/AcrR family transcriptional regulator [Candidatus Angelobacter sp.]|jgi:AcrR family transcriptional regulator|nr:TetR/AcrR family transcriptional regulator [Candidatus Angelobacter sp.]
MSDLFGGARRHGTTRERILNAANELFAHQGFARVSMRAVAGAAGVTKPALYYYFKDKESLFEECLADFNEQMRATMRAATTQPGAFDTRIRAVAEALLAGSPYHPVRIHEELAEHVSGGLRRRLRATFQTVVVAPVTDLFTDLQRHGELRDGITPAMAAAALIGTCIAFMPPSNGDMWQPIPLTGVEVPRPAEVVATLVLRGVAG